MSENVAYLNVASDVIPVTLQEAAISLTITNVSGGTLTIADNQSLNNSSTLTAGSSATFTENVWVKSASHSAVRVTWTVSTVSFSNVVSASSVVRPDRLAGMRSHRTMTTA